MIRGIAPFTRLRWELPPLGDAGLVRHLQTQVTIPPKFPGTFREAGHYLSKLGKVAACGRIGCSMAAGTIGHHYITLVPAFPLRHVPWDSPATPASRELPPMGDACLTSYLQTQVTIPPQISRHFQGSRALPFQAWKGGRLRPNRLFNSRSVNWAQLRHACTCFLISTRTLG